MEYAGEWDLPINPLLYKAFSDLPGAPLQAGLTAMPLTLHVDGRAGGRTSGG